VDKKSLTGLRKVEVPDVTVRVPVVNGFSVLSGHPAPEQRRNLPEVK
jgi:hypothetical protein